MYPHSRRLSFICVFFCLLVILSACGTIAGSGATPTPSPAKTSTHVAVTPTATPASPQLVQTCPPAGSSRAAVMPPMTVGNHANVVFLAQQDTGTLLQRYDVTTGATQAILQVPHLTPAPRATNLSPDGQWVLFEALLDGQSAIQLVRMDGQQLQTLYCAPAGFTVGSPVLSPYQHYLVFNQANADDTQSMLYLLDMRTGRLQLELSTQQPNYPVFGEFVPQGSLLVLSSPFSRNTKAADDREEQPFNPLGSKHFPMYVPMKWATNSSVYLLSEVVATPSPPPQLLLLRDIAKDVSQQESNVQPVVVASNANGCQDVDVTTDNQHIVCSVYTQFGPVGPSTILSQPTTGGAFHTIYRNPAGGSLNARALSNPSVIIFTLYRAKQPPALFKINSDGSGLSQVMAGSTTQTLLNLAASYLPWSNASRDSTLYALQLYDLTASKETLVYGHMSGGAPVPFASSTDGNQLDIVGWTEL